MKKSGTRVRNPRGQGDKLRADIVAAARTLLDEAGGADAITLRAVAREAGITAPSIYAHFADRDAVVEAVIEESFGQLAKVLAAALADVTDPVERLHAGCKGYLRFAAEHPQRYRVLFGDSRAPTPMTMDDGVVLDRAEFLALPGADTFAVMVDCIAACVAAGRSTSTDPFADAAALWSGMHGYSTLHNGMPHFPWPAPDAFVDALVDQLARVGPARPERVSAAATGPGAGR